MADKYIKEIVSITNHQGNVNQTTLSYHLMHTGMTTVKKNVSSFGENVE